MKFFCNIPWFKSLVTYVPSLLRLRNTLILSKIMTLAFKIHWESFLGYPNMFFTLLRLNFSFKLVLTKNFKGKCLLVCGAVRGSVLNEVDIKPARVNCLYFSNYELGRTQCSESWSDPNPKITRRNANEVICWQTKSSKKKSLLADPFS